MHRTKQDLVTWFSRSISGIDIDPWDICSAVSTPAWDLSIRDGVYDVAQAALGDGSARP